MRLASYHQEVVESRGQFRSEKQLTFFLLDELDDRDHDNSAFDLKDMENQRYDMIQSEFNMARKYDGFRQELLNFRTDTDTLFTL